MERIRDAIYLAISKIKNLLYLDNQNLIQKDKLLHLVEVDNSDVSSCESAISFQSKKKKKRRKNTEIPEPVKTSEVKDEEFLRILITQRFYYIWCMNSNESGRNSRCIAVNHGVHCDVILPAMW